MDTEEAQEARSSQSNGCSAADVKARDNSMRSLTCWKAMISSSFAAAQGSAEIRPACITQRVDHMSWHTTPSFGPLVNVQDAKPVDNHGRGKRLVLCMRQHSRALRLRPQRDFYSVCLSKPEVGRGSNRGRIQPWQEAQGNTAAIDKEP
eukprot:1158353-Pelagomonas_calceolata.AAC.1